jgi:putative tryptophan/tyrosine transport system substrate-binding protein
MKRRNFIALLGATVAWPLRARAQEAGRTYRLGCLLPLPHDAPINIAFFDELRRRGFIESQNLAVDYRAYGLHVDLISEYAAELVKARVDAIVTAGDVSTIRAAQQARKTIPILAMIDDMVARGLVASLARPEGNTTGVNILSIELDGKRQEILIEAVPGLHRIAFLADANFETVAKLDALREAARVHNIELSIHRIAKGEEIATAIDAAKASGAEALNFSASVTAHFESPDGRTFKT